MTDSCREAFEKTVAIPKALSLIQSHGLYVDVTTHWAWVGFQGAWNSRPAGGVDQEALEARWLEQSVDLKDVSWKAFVRAWYRTGWEDAVKVQAIQPKVVSREDIQMAALKAEPGYLIPHNILDAIYDMVQERMGKGAV